MKYIVINLQGKDQNEISTEIMFELAGAKIDGAELVRFNIENADDDSGKKRSSAMLKVLKNMKSAGKIQFYATPESFAGEKTEAVFLINKYPELFERKEPDNNIMYAYVKL